MRAALLALAAIVVAPACATTPAAEPAELVTTEWAPRQHLIEGYGGVPLVVQEWGNPDGPAILLLHGFSFNAESFAGQVGDLAREYRLIAPDLRGHGLSGKPWRTEDYADPDIWADDLARIAAALDLDRPLVVGWSFGGYVAANYVSRCAARCTSGMVLVGSLAGLVDRPPPPDPTKTDTPPPRGDSRADAYGPLRENLEWTAMAMTYRPPPAAEQARKVSALAMTPPYARRAMMGMQLDFRDRVDALQLPVLVLHGGRDISIPAASVAQLEAALPDARVLTYPDSGHSPFAEEADRFNADIAAFARETAATKP